jgi:flagellar biosynthesis protein FliR
MRGNVTLDISTLYGFLLVLSRVAGAFVFVPIPGIKDAPQAARVVLALALTVALYPSWPAVDSAGAGFGRVTGLVLAEAAFGITVGLTVAFLAEALTFAAQVVSMQAGFSYASTVDPTTEADSSVLAVFAQLAAGLLFFGMGLDRQILKIMARSLETSPPGSFRLNPAIAQSVVRFGGEMLSVGVRLALPVMALLLLVDLSLALLGRLNAQLQLLSMAFPAKMMTTLALLAWMTAVFPQIYARYAARMWSMLQELVRAHG